MTARGLLSGRLPALAVSALLVTALACGGEDYGTGSGDEQNGGGSGRTSSITMGDNFFQPRVDTVTVGSTVTWDNQGTVAHTTTSDEGTWDSGSKGPDESFSQTFDQAGTYPYHCVFHGAAGGVGMAGTLVVVPEGG